MEFCYQKAEIQSVNAVIERNLSNYRRYVWNIPLQAEGDTKTESLSAYQVVPMTMDIFVRLL